MVDGPIKVTGGCHCGAVRFAAEVEPDRETGTVELLDCSCSICTKTAYLHLIVPEAAFRLLRGADLLTRYRFGTGTAEHLFCSRCGIKSFYRPRSHPDHWSLNYRALDAQPGPGPALKTRIVPFDRWKQQAS